MGTEASKSGDFSTVFLVAVVSLLIDNDLVSHCSHRVTNPG